MHGYNFTEDVRRALATAALEARQRGSPHVAPEHVLLGLLAGTGNAVCHLLQRLQITAETLHRDLEVHLGQAVPTDSVADLPYSRSAKRALERAMGEALALGHASVETDHLLLAVCAAPGPAQQVLLTHGLTIERMRSTVREGHNSRRSHSLLSRMLVRLFHKIAHRTRTT